MKTPYSTKLDMTAGMTEDEILDLSCRLRAAVKETIRSEQTPLARAKMIYAETLGCGKRKFLIEDFEDQPWYGNGQDPRDLLDAFSSEFDNVIPWAEAFFGRRFLDDPGLFLAACISYASRTPCVAHAPEEYYERARKEFTVMTREEFLKRFGHSTFFLDHDPDCLIRTLQFSGDPETLIEDLEERGESWKERLYYAEISRMFDEVGNCLDDYYSEIDLTRIPCGLEWESPFDKPERWKYEVSGQYAPVQPEEVYCIAEELSRQA